MLEKMKFKLRIDNSVANVMKFLVIEIIVGLLIEPAITEINRFRAQHLATAGKKVKIRTNFLKRDFSGPAVGGKKGMALKFTFLTISMAVLMLTEFAFDYEFETSRKGGPISLIDISVNAPLQPLGIPEVRNLTKTLHGLEECSFVDGHIRYVRKRRPDGRCYPGNNSLLMFPEPCVVEAPHAHSRFGCVKNEGGGFQVLPHQEYFLAENYSHRLQNVHIVSVNPAEDNDFIGMDDSDGNPVAYCSNINDFICMVFVDASGDTVIGAFGESSGGGLSHQFSTTLSVRIGAHTFSEPGCEGCGNRIAQMVNLISSVYCVSQYGQNLGLLPNFHQQGVIAGMLAMGVPGEVEEPEDIEDVEQVGYIIIEGKLLLPLAIVSAMALCIRLLSRFRTRVVNVPLEYYEAMYAAFQLETSAGDCNLLGRRQKHSFDVGLVKTCEKDTICLSLNAKDTVRLSGANIRGSTQPCGRLECTRCERHVDACDTPMPSHCESDVEEYIENSAKNGEYVSDVVQPR